MVEKSTSIYNNGPLRFGQPDNVQTCVVLNFLEASHFCFELQCSFEPKRHVVLHVTTCTNEAE